MAAEKQTSSKTLLVITGPTAVGKTDLCVAIAKELQTEIISADSRQFFKELSIGTAKPSDKEMDGIPHYFIDSHSVEQDYNVSEYEQEALELIDKLFQSKDTLILTGGSMLYIDAICKGFDDGLPEGDDAIRRDLDELYEKYGISILQEKLKQLDPVFYDEIDIHNHKRLFRAIEVCMVAKQPYSELRKGITQSRNFNIVKIGLKRDREELYNRINLRVNLMMKAGLLEEAKSVYQYEGHNALKTVGYRELFEHFKDNYTLEEAVEKIKVNSRRYAKKQLAWFERDETFTWFHPNDEDEILEFIHQHIKNPLA